MKDQSNVISKRVNLIVESTSKAINNMLIKKFVGKVITIVDKHKGVLTGVCHKVTKSTVIQGDIKVLLIIICNNTPIITSVLLSEIKYG